MVWNVDAETAGVDVDGLDAGRLWVGVLRLSTLLSRPPNPRVLRVGREATDLGRGGLSLSANASSC